MILVKAGHTRNITNPYGRVKTLPIVSSDKLSKQIWALTEFFSVLPLLFIKVILPIEQGYFIVADRYVLDTIVSIAYYLNDQDFIKHRIAGVLLKFIPQKGVLIHLDADYDALVARRGKLVEPRSFIDFQKAVYARLCQSIPSYYIDTSKLTIDETSKAIFSMLRSYKVVEK
jgi:hypothetical protein